LTTLLLDYLLNCPVQVSGTGIVAEAFPGLQHFIQVGNGKSFQCGKTTEKRFIVGQNSFNPRLLEHDLCHPDGIGVTGVSPGEVAAVALIPD
jgi:hypothetical protein